MNAQELIQKFDISYEGSNTISIHTAVTDAELSLIELAKPQIIEIFETQKKNDNMARVMAQISSMRHSTDRMLSGIAWNAYDAICRGADPQQVADQYDQNMAAYFSIANWED